MRCLTVDADKRVAVRRLHPQAVLPAYARPGDAGADLASTARVTLEPGERALVPTGIAIAIPVGTSARSPGSRVTRAVLARSAPASPGRAYAGSTACG